MCYEDTIRVADLKTRPSRFAGIRAQVNAADGQPVRVIEYFHPRFEEFCDTMPAFLGRRLSGSAVARKITAPLFRKGRNVTTTGVSGFLALHLLAKMRRFRRFTYRYGVQRKMIDDWLDRVTAAACDEYEFGLAVARCIEIVRGYGDTHERGLTRYLATVDRESGGRNASEIRALHQAALIDEKGNAFDATLAAMGGRA